MVVAEAALHAATVAALALVDVRSRTTGFVYAVGAALGACDATLMNQIYKLLPQLFPGAAARAPAFSAYRFHAALSNGACFLLSRLLLGADGAPRMDAWAVLLLTLLAAEVAGVFAAVRSADSAGVADARVAEEVAVLEAGRSGASERTPLLLPTTS
ncbi:hypothetical protein HK405_003533 [Cladochytrium tenue]|nr:hypothetical protein HK405_003533 [Cladochytrium tenue]